MTFGTAPGELQPGWFTVKTAVPKPGLPVIRQASAQAALMPTAATRSISTDVATALQRSDNEA